MTEREQAETSDMAALAGTGVVDVAAAAGSQERKRTMLDTTRLPPETKQVVLVLQGGGALGAYQAGVYQALHEAGIEPDWVIGTSIGAINASLIAGNEPRIG